MQLRRFDQNKKHVWAHNICRLPEVSHFQCKPAFEPFIHEITVFLWCEPIIEVTHKIAAILHNNIPVAFGVIGENSYKVIDCDDHEWVYSFTCVNLTKEWT